jgi:hypothetical protein
VRFHDIIYVLCISAAHAHRNGDIVQQTKSFASVGECMMRSARHVNTDSVLQGKQYSSGTYDRRGEGGCRYRR